MPAGFRIVMRGLPEACGFSGVWWRGCWQTAFAASDQSNHELNLAEIGGTQKSSDEKWNNAAITYWGITDVVGGKGSQRGYFVNDHGVDSRDWGTFEGKVAANDAEITVEGKYQFTGGSG